MVLNEQKSNNSVAGLNLGRVDDNIGWVSGEIELAGKLYAALELHEEQDPSDPERRTIKQIIFEDLNLQDSLLVSYVAAFGAHGKQVLERFAIKQPKDGFDRFTKALVETRMSIGVQNTRLPQK